MDTAPDWFTIDENLPPKHTDVLVFLLDEKYAEFNGIYMGALFDSFLNVVWWVRYTEGTFPICPGRRVTHWRFLPNPPDK